jgi:hypothetical protein
MPIVKTREQWDQLLVRGRNRFLLENGVLRRGLPLGIVLAVILELYLGGRFPEALRNAAFWGRLALCVGVFSTSGALRSLAIWNAYRRRYAQGAGAPPRL